MPGMNPQFTDRLVALIRASRAPLHLTQGNSVSTVDTKYRKTAHW
jgi:hypothetical protein